LLVAKFISGMLCKFASKKIAAVDVSEVVHLLNKEYVTTVIQDVLFRVIKSINF